MDDKLIIEALVEQVKNGDIALEQIPYVWRDKVQELEEEEIPENRKI